MFDVLEKLMKIMDGLSCEIEMLSDAYCVTLTQTVPSCGIFKAMEVGVIAEGCYGDIAGALQLALLKVPQAKPLLREIGVWNV